jgi:hypothetical protein
MNTKKWKQEEEERQRRVHFNAIALALSELLLFHCNFFSVGLEVSPRFFFNFGWMLQ